MRSISSRPASVLAVAVLALVTACGSDDGSGADPVVDPEPPPTTASPTTAAPPTGSGPDLDGRELVATSVEGHDLVDDTTIRIAFADGTITASAGCNTISGGYDVVDETLVVDQLATTEMGCETDLMAQDRWLTDVLSLEPRIEHAGSTLTLQGVAGTTLEFVDRADAEPDAPLLETRWVLDGIRDGDAVSSVPTDVTASITLRSGDGDDGAEVLVEAGCNGGSGTVDIADDTMTFGPVALTRKMCGPDAMDVEAAVTTVLDGEVRYRIEADRLTIDTVDPSDPDTGEPTETPDHGLTFVATP